MPVPKKTKAPAKGSASNPYKLVRVTEPPPKPPKFAGVKRPAPKFETGDELSTVFKPINYNFLYPIFALQIFESDKCMSGWYVRVLTTIGEYDVDSGHFRKVTQAERP